MNAQTRMATVVLIDDNSRILGQLPKLHISSPWLQEVSELVAKVRQLHRLDIIVLRLLSVEDDDSSEISVTYLAELQTQGPATLALDHSLPQLKPWTSELIAHPLRMSYAQVGGPSADLNWAIQQITNVDNGTVKTMRQQRTWNLSSIWQLDTDVTTYWLKVVPPFFEHEANVINLLTGEAVPSLIASDGNRILMRNIAGEDCYDASETQMRLMIELLVDLQWRWQWKLDDRPVGMWDWQEESLVPAIQHALDCCQEEFDEPEYARLTSFVDSVPARLQKISAANIPNSLVHGDYHPGNWRGAASNLTILDWGDSGFGNVLLDLPGLLDRVPTQLGKPLEKHWLSCWRKHLPDANIEQAYQLIKPIAAARMAATYQTFLDNIEPSERVYHQSDPVMCLRNTLSLL